MYWERQQGSDTCRMHAVNAFLGGPRYTWPSFLAMCDRFDVKAGLSKGTSRTMYAATDDCTLFQFALQEAGSEAFTVPLAMYGSWQTDAKTQKMLEETLSRSDGAFVFNAQHVWIMKPTPRGWVRIDSLSGIQNEPLESVWRDGYGIEVIFSSKHDAPLPIPAPAAAPPVAKPAAMPVPNVSQPMQFGVPFRDPLPRAPARPPPLPPSRQTFPVGRTAQVLSGFASVPIPPVTAYARYVPFQQPRQFHHASAARPQRPLAQTYGVPLHPGFGLGFGRRF